MTVGPIAANVTCYPDFVEGQVLTHNDLNLLRDYLYSRWAFDNSCMFGFGVACGLDGTAGTQLSIDGGFALAQDGRLLRVAASASFDWSSIAGLAAGVKPANYGIDFLTGAGYTAVLVPNDVKTPLDTTCDPQTGCAAHTDQWCEGAQIVFAAGQLPVAGWEADDAFKLTPIDVDPKNGASKASFNALRSGLGKALKEIVPADTLALLAAISLEGPAGVDLMKVGLVNEVLFTLWDYLRCRAYDQGACCGPSGKAAVALGWVDPSKKSWDCTYRHHFQLSTALYRAMQGYQCEDLCSRYVDHILDLIQNFEVPTIPASNPPDNVPPVHTCTLEDYRNRRCNWHGPREKVDLTKLPGYVAYDPTRQPHPGDPVENYTLVVDDSLVLTMGLAIDPTSSGLVRLGDYLGYQDKATKVELDKAFTGGVQIVEEANFGATPNMQQAVVAARSDAVVLASNKGGAITGIGVIPTAQTLQQVSGLSVGVQDAKATSLHAADVADKASARADVAAKQALDVQASFTTYTEKLTGDFSKFEQQYGQKVSGAPEIGMLQEALTTLTRQHEQLQQAHAALAVDVEQKHGVLSTKLQQQAASVTKDLSNTATRISNRVDTFGSRLDAQAIAIHSGADTGKVGAVNASITGAFDALGAALLKAAGPERAAAVKGAVNEAQTYVDTLRTEGGGLLVTDTHPQVLANAMDSMLHAVVATGLNKNTNAYRDLNRSVTELGLALGMKIGSTG